MAFDDSLPRKLFSLRKALTTDTPGFDPYAPEAPTTLSPRSDARAIASALRLPGDTAWDVILLALRTLEESHHASSRNDVAASLVVSLPWEVQAGLPRTRETMCEMLLMARREVLAIGYEIRDGEVLGLLQQAARRGVDVCLLCDRVRASAPRIVAAWPANAPKPRVYQDALRPGVPDSAAMHGKGLLVDGQDLLLTSANLTANALNWNLEFGVRLRGQKVAEAREMFAGVLQSALVEVVVPS